MITSFLGEIGNNPENIFKISRKKILFIFCIFILYKVISISLDLISKYLELALQIIFVGFRVECTAVILDDQELRDLYKDDPTADNKIVLNCKYMNLINQI